MSFLILVSILLYICISFTKTPFLQPFLKKINKNKTKNNLLRQPSPSRRFTCERTITTDPLFIRIIELLPLHRISSKGISNRHAKNMANSRTLCDKEDR